MEKIITKMNREEIKLRRKIKNHWLYVEKYLNSDEERHLPISREDGCRMIYEASIEELRHLILKNGSVSVSRLIALFIKKKKKEEKHKE